MFKSQVSVGMMAECRLTLLSGLARAVELKPLPCSSALHPQVPLSQTQGEKIYTVGEAVFPVPQTLPTPAQAIVPWIKATTFFIFMHTDIKPQGQRLWASGSPRPAREKQYLTSTGQE